MASDSTLIALFRRGSLLEVVGGQFHGFFNLTSSSKLLVALAECVQSHLAPTTAATTLPPAPNNSPAPSNQPAEVASSSTAKSGGSIFTGTGIVVSLKGEILTNDHVISACHDIVVRRPDEQPVTASVLYADTTNDLAVLKIQESVKDEDVAQLRLVPTVKVGEQIAVYGFPLAGTLSETGNLVGGNVSALAGMDDDTRLLQITAPIQPGNSGGPLLDMSGNVVGVVNMKLDEMKVAASTGNFPQDVNFAIKGNIAANFLEARGVDFKSAAVGTTTDLTHVGDIARRFTVMIACE